jgi:hypothetical protein
MVGLVLASSLTKARSGWRAAAGEIAHPASTHTTTSVS